MLIGREGALTRIARMVSGARAGRGGALLLRGEPGSGKTVLLAAAAADSGGMTVLRCTGTQDERHLPYAALHALVPLHEVQTIGPATTQGYRYRVDYTNVDSSDYRLPAGTGVIEARVVVLAAGALGTPVILQRSAALLGGVPSAVGRNFSGNGDRVSVAVMDEEKVRTLLDLERAPGIAYDALHIGKPIGSMSYDGLDDRSPEFQRFSLQQIYFPTITNMLGQDLTAAAPTWFGVDKKGTTDRWRSWLTMLAMTEDDNEGVFGPPPPSGSFTRVASSAARGQITYKPTANTRRGWDASDAELRAILEKDGLAKWRPWTSDAGPLSAHPLSSCRLGDDPVTSALDASHELRGHPGLFVTDGSAVPTSLCVNPSLTIAALAERAVPGIVDRAAESGASVTYGAPAPGGETAGRRGVLALLPR